MKIGIYARGLSHKYGGVKEYLVSMISSLMKQLSKTDKLFIIHNLDKTLFPFQENVFEIRIKSSNRLICDFIKAPRVLNRLNLDVIWFSHNVIPFNIKTKKVVTEFDLGYFYDKLGAYTFLDRLYMKKMIKSSCKRADKIVAISRHTKKDILQLTVASSEKIEVIYPSVKTIFKRYKTSELVDVGNKFNLSEKFLLFTGGISPRKNIISLIKAFNKVAIEFKDIDLVLTGGSFASWNDKKEMKLINSNSKIKRLGYVSDEDLISLYNNALIYIYPSLYEGFGLPILEAQAVGCSVIASNATSIPEVIGLGGKIIDPLDVNALALAIEDLVKDEKLRKKYITLGFKNVQKFSWDKAAEKLFNLLKGLV